MLLWSYTVDYTPEDEIRITSALEELPAISITKSQKKNKTTLTALFDTPPKPEALPSDGKIHKLRTEDWQQRDQVSERGLVIERLTTVFGTDHPTTQLCLTMLEDHCNTIPAKTRFLDVGTGTGILSLWLIRQGIAVDSIDHDAEAISLATANATANNLPTSGFKTADIQSYTYRPLYGGIMANIPTEVHPYLHNRVNDLMMGSGWGLFSGFQTRYEDQVLQPYLDLGFQLISRKTKDDWVAVLLKRRKNVS